MHVYKNMQPKQKKRFFAANIIIIYIDSKFWPKTWPESVQTTT